VSAVSRPNSAFNRLGSFIGWEPKYLEFEDAYKELAESGFIMDEENRNLIQLQLNNTNVPLYKTLNYLSRLSHHKNTPIDIISS
jgi:hypothetical protein